MRKLTEKQIISRIEKYQAMLDKIDVKNNRDRAKISERWYERHKILCAMNEYKKKLYDRFGKSI